MHLFEIKLKHYDRMTTKSQWKAISHWLRVVRNRIDEKKMFKAVHNAMVYGEGVYE